MKRFLIANPFGLGDALFSLASAEKIRQEHPEAFIGFIGNERTEELLRLCPILDRVYVFNRDFLKEAWKKSPLSFFGEVKKLTDTIAKDRYEVLIDFSLGREFSLVAGILGIRQRVGFDYRGRGIFLTHKKKIKGYTVLPVAQEQLNCLRQFEVIQNVSMPSVMSWRLPETSVLLKGSDPFLAVAPGGGKSWGKDATYKQWDGEKFIEVLNHLSKQNIFKCVVFLGDQGERELLEKVQKGVLGFESHLLIGEPLATVGAVLKQAQLLLCNDGGLLHFANALGTKTVSIFGPVDEKVYGPYGGQAPRRILTAPTPCRPCYQNFHFPPCAYERRCLTEISAHKVIEAIQEIL